MRSRVVVTVRSSPPEAGRRRGHRTRLRSRPRPRRPDVPLGRPSSLELAARARGSLRPDCPDPRRARRVGIGGPPVLRVRAACASASASGRRSTASGSRSPRARRTACSDRTAPARRRRSRWSAGSCAATRARSSSPAARSTRATTALKAEIGYVPQDLAIYPDLSARENLSSSGGCTGCAGRPERARRRGPRRGRPGRPREGARRAVLRRHEAPAQHRASACSTEPSLLVLDEPTVGRRPAEPQRDPVQRRGARARRAWPSSTRPTTWRRPSASATGSGSSTRGGSSPRARGASWSPSSAAATA